MAGCMYRKFLFCIFALMILVSLVSGGTVRVGNGQSNNAASLDLGILLANDGDTILLDNVNGTINSTLTSGNLTVFDKNLYIGFTSPGDIATIRLNNSIHFSGSKHINFTADGQKLYLWVDPDPAVGGTYVNNTLVQFLGATDLFNSTKKTDSTMVINAGTTFTGTALNVTSDGNGINLGESSGTTLTGHILGDSKIAVNISGSNNYVEFDPGNGGDINATDFAVNLIGKNNYMIVDTDQMNAKLGRLYIHGGATGNYIHDFVGAVGTPQYSIYNGSAYSAGTYFGYFYNRTWSPDYGNMNVSISVRNLPYGGNTTIKAEYDNVTGSAGDYVLNNTLTADSNALFDGIAMNTTESVIFANMVSEVPVKYTFGGNTIYFNWLSTAFYNEYPVGSVRIVNFNPYNSITALNMNATYTSNWTTYNDFSAVKPSFVVDNGTVDHMLLGNLTFAENINLLDLTTINQLQQLGNSIKITNSSIFLDSTVLTQFDKKAVLTMYPAFDFTTTANLVLKVTPDGGAETTLWDGTAYSEQSTTYLTTDTIDINTTTNSTTIWTKGFSKFAFSKYTASPTPGPSGGSGAQTVSGSGGTNDITVGVAKNLKEGENVGFTISQSSIYEVTATVNTDVPKMMVTVEKKHPDRGIEEVQAEVYEYDQVNMYWALNSEISRAAIEFKVGKDWLAKAGYTYRDIVMLRYNGNTKEWEQLPTEYIDENDDYYLYRATTSGFSWFAISAEEGATIVTDGKSTKIVHVVAEEESPESLDALKNGAETEEAAATEPTPAPLGAASFVSVFIAGVILFLRRR